MLQKLLRLVLIILAIVLALILFFVVMLMFVPDSTAGYTTPTSSKALFDTLGLLPYFL